MNFDELVKRVTSATERMDKLIDFPVPQGMESFKVRLWWLTDQETQQAVMDAERHIQQLSQNIPGMSDKNRADLLEQEEERQILFRAVRNAERPDEPLCTSMETWRKLLYADMRQALIQHYLAFVDDMSPLKLLKGDTTEEKVATLRNFREAGDQALSDYLSSCDFVTLRNIVRLLADRL